MMENGPHRPVRSRAQEEGLARPRIRSVEALRAGSRVEARYKGGSEWYPGMIMRVDRGKISGSVYFTIKYDDGDVEKGVRRLRVRREGLSEEEVWRLVEGMEVDVSEAAWNLGSNSGSSTDEDEGAGNGHYYRIGEIVRVHRDGRYDVAMDLNGEVVERVPRELLAAQCEAGAGLQTAHADSATFGGRHDSGAGIRSDADRDAPDLFFEAEAKHVRASAQQTADQYQAVHDRGWASPAQQAAGAADPVTGAIGRAGEGTQRVGVGVGYTEGAGLSRSMTDKGSPANSNANIGQAQQRAGLLEEPEPELTPAPSRPAPLSFDQMMQDQARDARTALTMQAAQRSMALKPYERPVVVCGGFAMNAYARLASNDPSLLILHEEGHAYGEDVAVGLGQALAQNRYLVELRLGDNALGDVGACWIAWALREQSHRSLRVLDLAQNGIGDIGAAQLAQALAVGTAAANAAEGAANAAEERMVAYGSECHDHERKQAQAHAENIEAETMHTPICQLRSLHLDFNDNIGDSGANALAKAIEAGAVRHQRLHSLTLAHTGIGVGGARALACAARAALRLRRLTLVGARVDVAATQEERLAEGDRVAGVALDLGREDEEAPEDDGDPTQRPPPPLSRPRLAHAMRCAADKRLRATSIWWAETRRTTNLKVGKDHATVAANPAFGMHKRTRYGMARCSIQEARVRMGLGRKPLRVALRLADVTKGETGDSEASCSTALAEIDDALLRNRLLRLMRRQQRRGRGRRADCSAAVDISTSDGSDSGDPDSAQTHSVVQIVDRGRHGKGGKLDIKPSNSSSDPEQSGEVEAHESTNIAAFDLSKVWAPEPGCDMDGVPRPGRKRWNKLQGAVNSLSKFWNIGLGSGTARGDGGLGGVLGALSGAKGGDSGGGAGTSSDERTNDHEIHGETRESFPLGAKAAASICAALAHDTMLTALDLSFCTIGDKGAMAVAELIAPSPSRSVLWRGLAFDAGHKTGAVLQMPQGGNSSLTHLALRQTGIARRGATAIAAAALRAALYSPSVDKGDHDERKYLIPGGGGTLTSLDLGLNSMPAAATVALSAMLAGDVEHLLGGRRRSLWVSPARRQVSHSTSLPIGTNTRWAMASTASWSAQASNAATRPNDSRDSGPVTCANQTLHTLLLDGNTVGNEGAMALAGALSITASVASQKDANISGAAVALLGLNSSHIGPHGARQLASMLSCNRSLTALRLRDNKLGTDGSRALRKGIKRSLTLLYCDCDLDTAVDEQDGTALGEEWGRATRGLVRRVLQRNRSLRAGGWLEAVWAATGSQAPRPLPLPRPPHSHALSRAPDCRVDGTVHLSRLCKEFKADGLQGLNRLGLGASSALRATGTLPHDAAHEDYAHDSAHTKVDVGDSSTLSARATLALGMRWVARALQLHAPPPLLLDLSPMTQYRNWLDAKAQMQHDNMFASEEQRRFNNHSLLLGQRQQRQQQTFPLLERASVSPITSLNASGQLVGARATAALARSISGLLMVGDDLSERLRMAPKVRLRERAHAHAHGFDFVGGSGGGCGCGCGCGEGPTRCGCCEGSGSVAACAPLRYVLGKRFAPALPRSVWAEALARAHKRGRGGGGRAFSALRSRSRACLHARRALPWVWWSFEAAQAAIEWVMKARDDARNNQGDSQLHYAASTAASAAAVLDDIGDLLHGGTRGDSEYGDSQHGVDDETLRLQIAARAASARAASAAIYAAASAAQAVHTAMYCYRVAKAEEFQDQDFSSDEEEAAADAAEVALQQQRKMRESMHGLRLKELQDAYEQWWGWCRVAASCGSDDDDTDDDDDDSNSDHGEDGAPPLNSAQRTTTLAAGAIAAVKAIAIRDSESDTDASDEATADATELFDAHDVCARACEQPVSLWCGANGPPSCAVSATAASGREWSKAAEDDGQQQRSVHQELRKLTSNRSHRRTSVRSGHALRNAGRGRSRVAAARRRSSTAHQHRAHGCGGAFAPAPSELTSLNLSDCRVGGAWCWGVFASGKNTSESPAKQQAAHAAFASGVTPLEACVDDEINSNATSRDMLASFRRPSRASLAVAVALAPSKAPTYPKSAKKNPASEETVNVTIPAVDSSAHLQLACRSAPLMFLSLERCGLRVVDLAPITAALATAARRGDGVLATLSLSGNPLGDAGATLIASAVVTRLHRRRPRRVRVTLSPKQIFAAKILQAHARRWLASLQVARTKAAVVVLQSAVRRWLTKRIYCYSDDEDFESLPEELSIRSRDNAALQAHNGWTTDVAMKAAAAKAATAAIRAASQAHRTASQADRAAHAAWTSLPRCDACDWRGCSLTSLRLDRCAITSLGACVLAAAVRRAHGLRMLSMCRNRDIGDDGACALAAAFAAGADIDGVDESRAVPCECECARVERVEVGLRDLRLSRCAIGDGGFEALAKALTLVGGSSPAQNVTEMDTGNKFELLPEECTTGTVPLCRPPHAAPAAGLRALDLSCNRGTVRGIGALAHALEANTTLHSLRLEWQAVGGKKHMLDSGALDAIERIERLLSRNDLQEVERAERYEWLQAGRSTLSADNGYEGSKSCRSVGAGTSAAFFYYMEQS